VTHAPPGPERETRGAFHESEIDYVFNSLYATDKPWEDADRKIAEMMSSYWANFAATGNPNGKGLPPWPTLDPRSPQTMELGARFEPIPVADSVKVDFFKRFFSTQDALVTRDTREARPMRTRRLFTFLAVLFFVAGGVDASGAQGGLPCRRRQG